MGKMECEMNGKVSFLYKLVQNWFSNKAKICQTWRKAKESYKYLI